MKNRTGLIVGGAAGVAVILLICLFLSKPKATDSGDSECLFPYTYQKAGKGILVTLSGEFSKDGWQVSGTDNPAVSVAQKRNSPNTASFLITAKEEGYVELTFTLEDGSEQNGYRISIPFYVDAEGVLSVGESSHVEANHALFDGVIGSWCYTGKISRNVMNLEVEGNSDFIWNAVSEMSNLSVEGPFHNFLTGDSTETPNDGVNKKQTGTNSQASANKKDEGNDKDMDADVSAENDTAETLTIEAIPTADGFTFTAYGSGTGYVVVCSGENELALRFALETDENGLITLLNSEMVPYDSSTMDPESRAMQKVLNTIGESILDFSGFNPRSYGTAAVISDTGLSCSVAYLLLTVNQTDWYCEMTADMDDESFSKSRAYTDAVNSEKSAAGIPVILSQAGSTMTVFWEQNGVAYRISSQAESSEEEALSAAEILILSGKSAS